MLPDPAPRPPARRLGIVGGGQLARMMLGPAIELGLPATVLATDPAESAAAVAGEVRIGRHDDEQAVRGLAGAVDAVTFDHEHVPTAILEALEAEGVAVRPGPAALVHAQDKLVMRERLSALGHPCPRWWRITSAEDLADALAQAGGRLVVKTPRGGYDGHGVRVISDPAEVADWAGEHDELLAEELVPFARELSAQVARRPDGEAVAYPVVQSLQKDGVCYEVVAPAPGLDEAAQERIQSLALAIAEDLGVVGMLAVELFETADGTVSVNELAMRPHNTGHWSMDGAVTGQFEQHLRAVADLPLGATTPLAPVAVMVNLLGGEATDLVPGMHAALALEPALKVHLYGKGVRPGRKIGHVTLLGEDAEDLLARAHRAERLIIDGVPAPGPAGTAPSSEEIA
ncbi:5-(carboxyamino)imidazole ribonucleotide synthase [Brachybacterium sp. J144]|uniref:5-(carboxyamino)imidazole ribonucleotide synthase n=1 Tax=Brachybacterium sp. J144 TaxID=3116487 RepID=UPI002E76044C|nr:5-(carboxyamino)imidazole ribonucleotide synthase [Brachybacterium sp. J144]MEE1649560.1 5-(carboxyamino)imidazole ribonucleotide synthase [Brachybacterium sp. J144]